MPSVPPLWEGYADTSEQDLLGLLDDKVERALDDNDSTVDVRATRDLAQAIASHEWLKEREEGANHPELFAYARRVAKQDPGSWRPR